MMWKDAEEKAAEIFQDRFQDMCLMFAPKAGKFNRYMIVLKKRRDSGRTVDVVASGESWEECIFYAKKRELEET